jgi:hypothetical protein
VPAVTKNSNAFVINKGFELNIAWFDQNQNLRLTVRANGSLNDNSIDGITTNGGRIVGTTIINENVVVN